MQDQISQLSQFLPSGQAEQWVPILKESNCLLKITKTRKSKFGDYKGPDGTRPYHVITVNGTLNKYAFLITLLHELAHLQVYSLFKRRIKPHGPEWKTAFALLLKKVISQNVFPSDLLPSILKYTENPKASSASDSALYFALKKYDKEFESKTHLNDLALNSFFNLNGKTFQLGPKKRTRYLCKEVSSKKSYFVHQLAEVIPVKNG